MSRMAIGADQPDETEDEKRLRFMVSTVEGHCCDPNGVNRVEPADVDRLGSLGRGLFTRMEPTRRR
jgi:hypothetical protein